MRGETMKDKSKKSTYSTTFGIDPDFLTFLYLNKESAGMIRAQKKRGEVAF